MEKRKMYDWSPELKAALVADDDFNDIEYIDLEVAPRQAEVGSTGYLLLPMLHTLAYARLLGGFAEKRVCACKKWVNYANCARNRSYLRRKGKHLNSRWMFAQVSVGTDREGHQQSRDHLPGCWQTQPRAAFHRLSAGPQSAVLAGLDSLWELEKPRMVLMASLVMLEAENLAQHHSTLKR